MLMWVPILAIWGCMPEITKDCVDMTNSSSTYLGIAGGAAIGAVISWWIYNRQKKTSKTQEEILQRIEKLEEKNRKILSHIEQFTSYHNTVLEKIVHMNERILSLQTKIESMTGKKG
jgi:predicted RNase H-like nuclease (RuvC/YqgF family)